MALRLRDLGVRYGPTVALADADLSVAFGEIVALVGPSGCGKSSLLRAVAGLVPATGSVHGPGGDLSRLPAHRRGVGVVFQDHALFPHLSVADNVAFGLVEGGMPRAERRQRVRDWLERVGLGERGDDPVDHLSGGERQRIALARALAPEPGVLLLDEPFASLDPGLRNRLSLQVAGLARQQAAATLFVTHDLDEALLVADRVAVLRAGRLQQVDTPERLMAAPTSPWVARFLGLENVWEGEAAAALPGSPAAALLLGEHLRWWPDDAPPADDTSAQDAAAEGVARVPAILLDVQRLREAWRLRLGVPLWGVELSWVVSARELPAQRPPEVGARGTLEVPHQAWVCWFPEGGTP